MNIFVLDHNTEKAAQYHCDKHLIKMILETLQILRTASANLKGYGWEYGYATSKYKNHPCIKWAGQSYGNYIWLRGLGIDLCKEYTFRYEKIHKCQDLILQSSPPIRTLKEELFNCKEITQRPLCMPSIYKISGDPIECYRNYYIEAKTNLLSYTKREVPEWLKCHGLGIQK